MPEYILGTGLSHDGSAVLVKDGRVAVAIEKERITRSKHDGGNDTAAIAYCLDAEGITINDLDLVVQCANFEKDEIGLTHYKGPRIFPAGYSVPVISISHHLAHAWSAFGTAPFESGHVFVLDGCGSPYQQCEDLHGTINLNAIEMLAKPATLYCEKDSFYRFNGNGLHASIKDFSLLDQSSRPYPLSPFTTQHSIGGLYSAASHYCFGNMDDAGKLMGLAPYGDEKTYTHALFRKEQGRVFLIEEAIKEFKRPVPDAATLRTDFRYYANIANWVQREVEEAILYTLDARLQTARVHNLCYSGGVALNALANKRILHETGIRNLHIEPAAGDNGLALGCAFYGWMHVMQRERVMHDQSTCFGRSYSSHTTEQALASQNKLSWQRSKNVEAETAALLAEGNIVGWFSGGSEFGPRALGRRSILADPRKSGVRDFINREIKCREDFRPFAPSMLREAVTTYFKHDMSSPYMLLVNDIRPEYENMLAAVVHENKTARLQTVTADLNPSYHRLLSEFGALTGLPMLLNTSFNKRGTPMVETPADAIAFFAQSKLDVLVIDEYIIHKKSGFSNALTATLATFLESVGIGVEPALVEEETFLPGVRIDKGKLYVDESKLKHPGDLLHEAGHIAVMTGEIRMKKAGNVGEDEDQNMAMGEEIMAIAWSYAALKKIGLEPQVVFHPEGYKGASDWYIEQFESGNYIGLHGLQWIGLCYDQKNADANQVAPFPHMLSWLRS